jgi:hypothetical protein
MKTGVWFPIEPLLLDLRAYLDMQLRRYSNEASIEKSMEVRSQEHAVRHFVYAALRKWPDMCRFEDRKSTFARDSTTTLV